MQEDSLEFKQLRAGAPSIYFCEGDFDKHHSPVSERVLREHFLARGRGYEYRGVSIDRLPRILATGIDVEPTNGPIWVGSFEKAWEYGGLPKVVMVLAMDALEPSFVSRSKDADPKELEDLKAAFSYVTEFEGKIWFSLVADPNPGYEVPYGRRIAGDAREALVAVFIFGPASKVVSALRAGSTAGPEPKVEGTTACSKASGADQLEHGRAR